MGRPDRTIDRPGKRAGRVVGVYPIPASGVHLAAVERNVELGRECDELLVAMW